MAEISLPRSHDVEREATLTRAKFEKFAKSFFQSKNSQLYSKPPLNEPVLAKKRDLDRTVSDLVAYQPVMWCLEALPRLEAASPSRQNFHCLGLCLEPSCLGLGLGLD